MSFLNVFMTGNTHSSTMAIRYWKSGNDLVKQRLPWRLSVKINCKWWESVNWMLTHILLVFPLSSSFSLGLNYKRLPLVWMLPHKVSVMPVVLRSLPDLEPSLVWVQVMSDDMKAYTVVYWFHSPASTVAPVELINQVTGHLKLL
jgi:hypothetical protein